MKRLPGFLLFLATVAALSWAAFYFRIVFFIGGFTHWHFAPMDWAEATVVGAGPLALALAAIIVTRRRWLVRNSN